MSIVSRFIRQQNILVLWFFFSIFIICQITY